MKRKFTWKDFLLGLAFVITIHTAGFYLMIKSSDLQVDNLAKSCIQGFVLMDSWILSDEEYRIRNEQEQARQKSDFFENYIENPSSYKLAKLLRNAKYTREGLRGLIIDGKTYWWDAYYGTHTDGTRWLFPEITEYGDARNSREIELHLDEDDTIYACGHKEALDLLLNHSTMKGKWLNGCMVEK